MINAISKNTARECIYTDTFNKTIFRFSIENFLTNGFVEVATSSDDPSYFLLVWNVVTILQHFLFCKWKGIQKCLHRRFPIAIFPAVRT